MPRAFRCTFSRVFLNTQPRVVPLDLSYVPCAFAVGPPTRFSVCYTVRSLGDPSYTSHVFTIVAVPSRPRLAFGLAFTPSPKCVIMCYTV